MLVIKNIVYFLVVFQTHKVQLNELLILLCLSDQKNIMSRIPNKLVSYLIIQYDNSLSFANTK